MNSNCIASNALCAYLEEVLGERFSLPALVVDGEQMNAFTLTDREGGGEVFSPAPAESCRFFRTAAEALLGDTSEAPALLTATRDTGRGFRNLLRGGMDFTVSEGVSGSDMLRIYTENFEPGVKALIGSVPEDIISSGCTVIFTGELAAFYPACITLKAAISPFPFNPLKNFVTDERLHKPIDLLTGLGAGILDRREREKRRIGKNLRLQVVTSSGAEGRELITLAAAGCDLAPAESAPASPPIIAKRGDAITLFSNITCHTLPLPDAVFKEGDELALLRFSILPGETCPLLHAERVHGDGSADIPLDAEIYTEVKTNGDTVS